MNRTENQPEHLLISITKNCQTLFAQTKTKPQEMLEFTMGKQMQTFSINSPITLSEQDSCLLSFSSFETTNYVFILTVENNSFSISIPGHRNSKSAEKTVDELNKILTLTSENDAELRVGEVRKRGQQIKIGDKEYKLLDLGFHKNEINEELKNVGFNDFENLVFRMLLTYNEIASLLDMKNIDAKFAVYTFPPRIYEVYAINLMLKSLFPDDVEKNTTNNDITLKSNLTTNKTIRLTKNFFYLYDFRFC